jgi:hypothetical protein
MSATETHLRTYVHLTHLVSIARGDIPPGYVEVETTMLAPGLRDVIKHLREQDEIHWKTRRGLLAEREALVDALRECVAAYVDVDHANTYTSDDTLSVVKANERIRAAQVKARAALTKADA